MKVPIKQWQLLHVYKVFWPPEFKIAMAGEVIELKDINVFPPAKQEQITLMPIDKNMRSEYNVKRDPTMG